MRISVIFLPLLLLVASCDGDESIVCTTEARFGVNVVVRDAVTGQPVLEAVRGALHEGSYLDSLEVIHDIEGRIASLVGAVERPGTYRVEVVAEGYRPWLRTDVRVSADRCHVIPVAIQVDLVPVGG